MSDAAPYDGFTVTPLNKTNGAKSDYVISYLAKIPLEDGDLFYATFPKTIRTPKEPVCKLGDCLEELSCTSETGRIVVTFTKLKPGCANKVNTQVTFTIEDIQNSPNFIPSAGIESYRTSKRYQKISEFVPNVATLPDRELRVANDKFANLNHTEVSIIQEDENFA